jgi:hypothetical protein
MFNNDMNNQSTNMNNHGFMTNSLNNNNSFNFINESNSLSNASYQHASYQEPSYQNNDINNHTSTIGNNMFLSAPPRRSQSAGLPRAVSAGRNNSISLGNSSHSRSGGSNSREQYDRLLNRMDNDSVDYLVNTFCRP